MANTMDDGHITSLQSAPPESQQSGDDTKQQTQLQKELDQARLEKDELQKELTTLKRLIGVMSDSSWKERLKDEEYLNWIKCTMALVETKNALSPAVEDELKKLYAEVLTAGNITEPSEHDCYTTFNDVQFCKERGNRKLYIAGTCEGCQKAFEKLISFSKLPRNEEVMKVIKENCQGDTLVYHHWPMAKAFMPKLYRKTTEARDLDPAAMIRLLGNCNRFTNTKQKQDLLDKVAKVRNQLMHSSDNKVSYERLESNMDLMIDLLQEGCWGTRPECIKMVDKIQELMDNKQSLQIHDDTEEEAAIEKAALEVKNQSVIDDIAEKKETGEDTTELQAVKHINEQRIDEITNKERVDAFENRHKNVMEEMKKVSQENTELEKAKKELATKCDELENRLRQTPSRDDVDSKLNEDKSIIQSKSLDHGDTVKIHERTLHRIKTSKADDRVLDIFGCCQLENGTLVMADRTGTANLVCSETYKILHRLSVVGCPTTVCSAGLGTIALGTEEHGTYVLSVTDNVISLLRTLKTCECIGLAYYDEELFVSDRADSVLVYSMTGQLLRTISGMFESPRHLVVSSDGSKLYVADFDKGLVTVNRQGKLLSVLADSRVNRMCGVCVDELGRVFVVGFRSHNLCQVDATGTRVVAEIGKEAHKLNFPSSVCFDRINFSLIVTNLGCDDITVFHLEK